MAKIAKHYENNEIVQPVVVMPPQPHTKAWEAFVADAIATPLAKRTEAQKREIKRAMSAK